MARERFDQYLIVDPAEVNIVSIFDVGDEVEDGEDFRPQKTEMLNALMVMKSGDKIPIHVESAKRLLVRMESLS